jgi:uncharacterized protein YeaO (DUF488 family)
MIQLKRVYDRSKTRSSQVFLVERLWPRGVKKESLHFHAWLKDVAPSDSLRRWFQHDVKKWPEFRKRYRAELDARPEAWAPLLAAAREGDVILLYSSRDTEHNNAVMLRDYLEQKLRRQSGKRARVKGKQDK